MKLTIYILTFIFSLQLLAQEKYLIYLKDKGDYSEQTLSKISDHERLAEKFLSKRSIERRKKVNGDEFLTFQDLPIDNAYLVKLQELGIKITHKLKWFNAVSAYLTNEEVKELIKEDFVLRIEKVKKFLGSEPSNKTVVLPKVASEYSSTYTYNYGNSLTQNELSDIPQVHEMGITGEGVIIGLLDSGFNWKNHISLKDRKVIAERDFIFNDNETADEDGIDYSGQHNHGTSVFSILAGFDEANLIGPAFDAEFLLAKTEYIPTETHSEEDNYAAALEWMDSIGVDITTSSVGYGDGFDKYGEENYTYEDMDGKSTIVTRAAEMAFDRGIVVITSAGNEGNTSWKYITAPGDGFNILTVGAVSSSNIVVSFSSEGPTFDGRIKPEIVAMGYSLINARASTTDSYSIGNGTSYSAPIAAGVAGMLLSAHPHLTNSQVRSIMMESGDNTENPDNERGYGLVSALKAVTYPNLGTDGDSYILRKIFANDSIINEQSVELVLDDGLSYPMEKIGDSYTVTLPAMQNGDIHEIYFNYRDIDDNQFRNPSEKNYRLTYGQLNIELNVSTKPGGNFPNKYQLLQNYPNPFNPVTRIDYILPSSHESSEVKLKLYNVLGAEVKTLVDEIQSAGTYSVELSSGGLSSGVYFYTLQTDGFVQTRKLIILK